MKEAIDKKVADNLSALIPELYQICGDRISLDVDLSLLSRWKIGGKARVVAEPRSSEEVSHILRLLHGKTVPVLVLGDTTNLLFDSNGFNGLIIRISRFFSAVTFDNDIVHAQAGIWVPLFVRKLGSHGLSGAEHAVGIPGTLGGLVVMNGGSQRKGIGEHVIKVSGVLIDGTPFEYSRESCNFNYRSSVFQDGKHVVLEATFRFNNDDRSRVRREMIDILSTRKKKFPKNLPNCGSTFLSNPAMYEHIGPPGKAIEDVGLKGFRYGNAQISPLHANFLINAGGATSHEVLYLVALVRNTVYKKTGYLMDCEVLHVGAEGNIRPAHEVAEEVYGSSMTYASGAITTNFSAI